MSCICTNQGLSFFCDVLNYSTTTVAELKPRTHIPHDGNKVFQIWHEVSDENNHVRLKQLLQDETKTQYLRKSTLNRLNKALAAVSQEL